MHSAGWIQKVKNNLKGSLQDLKKLSRQLSKEQTRQKKAAEAAIKQQQRIEMAVTDEDRKIFLASIRGTKPIGDSNRIEASAAKTTARQVVFFKLKGAQAEGKDILALQHRGSAAKSDSLPAHAQASSRTDSIRPAKLSDELSEGAFLRSPDAADVIKKLRRGQWPVEATLDLHGSTLEQAAERFDRFMQTCIEHQIRCVCVIHGQGYGSKNQQPVLKEPVRSWLRDLPAVSAYIPAPENIGGDGAVIVLLKS